MYALFAIGGSLYQGAIPILATEVFSFTLFQAGLLLTLTGVIYILTDGPIGVLVDLIGCRNGALLGLGCAATTALLALSSQSLAVFLIGVIFFALSWNIMSISSAAYILRTGGKEVSGRLFGIQGSLFVFGNVIGAFGVGHVSAGGIAYSGLVFLLTSLAAGAFVLFFLHPNEIATRSASLKWFQWRPGIQAMRDFAPVSWVSALNGFVNYTFGSAIWLIIPLSLARLSNNLFPEGTALGIFQFSGIVTIFAGGYLADHHSRKKLFLILLLIETVGVLCLGIVNNNILIFLILALLATSALDAAQPVLSSMLSDVNKGKNNEGALEGFTGMLSDFGFLVGPLVGGVLFETFGLNSAFIFLGILMILNWLASHWLLRKFDSRILTAAVYT